MMGAAAMGRQRVPSLGVSDLKALSVFLADQQVSAAKIKEFTELIEKCERLLEAVGDAEAAQALKLEAENLRQQVQQELEAAKTEAASILTRAAEERRISIGGGRAALADERAQFEEEKEQQETVADQETTRQREQATELDNREAGLDEREATLDEDKADLERRQAQYEQEFEALAVEKHRFGEKRKTAVALAKQFEEV